MILRLWDRLASLLAAILSALIAGIPAWATWLAISAGLIPSWAYAALAGLIFVGAVMVVAFLRKMRDGIGPFRDRRR